MTLAEFYALQSSPQAIIVPRRAVRAGAARRSASAADAKSAVSAAMPKEGSADKKH
jgi:hypothetical protein